MRSAGPGQRVFYLSNIYTCIYIYLDICGQIRLHLPAAKPLGSKRKTQHFVEQTMHTHTEEAGTHTHSKGTHTHSEDTHTEGTQTQGAHTQDTHTGHSYTQGTSITYLCLLCASFTFLLHTLRGTCTSDSSALALALPEVEGCGEGSRVR